MCLWDGRGTELFRRISKQTARYMFCCFVVCVRTTFLFVLLRKGGSDFLMYFPGGRADIRNFSPA